MNQRVKVNHGLASGRLGIRVVFLRRWVQLVYTRFWCCISRAIAKLNKLAKENISDTEELKALDAERLELMRELNEAVREAEKKGKN